MSQEALKLAVCERALSLLQAQPNAFIVPIYTSVESQLLWLIDYFSGKESNTHRLQTLTFGHYAVRELSPRYGELYSGLNAAFYVAAKTREGVKVDVGLLEDFLSSSEITPTI